MQKTFNELEDYACKMHARGDSWRSIVAYLDEHLNEDEVRTIIRSIKAKKERGELHVAQPEKEGLNLVYLLIGGTMVLFGLYLLTNLWDRGWISTLPFILMAMGLGGIFKELNG